MNTFFDKRSWFLGVTMAASWAWGSSLMVGLSVIGEKGMLPFIIWAIANSLAVPIFGYVAPKLWAIEKIVRNKYMLAFMVAIQMFAVWINIQAIYQVSTEAGFTDIMAKTFAIAIGIFFIVVVYKNGLKMSMITDQFQWGIMFVGMTALIIWGAFNGSGGTTVDFSSMNGHMKWAILGGLSLFAHPFLDIQQWQRARLAWAEKKQGAFLVSGFTFAVYMAGILTFSSFERTQSMSILLLIIAIMVATSTMDSSAVAMHELAGRKWGVAIGLLAVASWQIIYEFGIVGIWNIYATGRTFVVTGLIIIALVIQARHKKNQTKNKIKK